jgi:hypothetical protein
MDPFSPSFDPFEAGTDKAQGPERPGLYSNVSLNSSAPMLSLASQGGRPPRSVTSPMPRKRLNWAPECAIYHTFHATEYDRRSEPATCNRLTPALAQEIKDELNGFKMEEMAVHPSSRIHTHFLWVKSRHQWLQAGVSDLDLFDHDSVWAGSTSHCSNEITPG